MCVCVLCVCVCMYVHVCVSMRVSVRVCMYLNVCDCLLDCVSLCSPAFVCKCTGTVSVSHLCVLLTESYSHLHDSLRGKISRTTSHDLLSAPNF